jgi:hypothetical protein
MSKGILIYSERLVGDQIKVGFDFVPFSKQTTEYNNSLSYMENMEGMIYDILERGFVFINETIAIPIFCIKAFKAKAEDNQDNQSNQSNQSNQKVIQNTDVKKWKPINHGKKMNRRIRHHGQNNLNVIPVKPEDILKQNSMNSGENNESK